MKLFLTIGLLSVLQMRSGAAIVVTHTDPVWNPVNNPILAWSRPGLESASFQLDVDGNGSADYRFWRGSLQAGLESVGSSRFVSSLEGSVTGGYEITPLSAGTIIGDGLSLGSGEWHSHFDGGGSAGHLLGTKTAGGLQLSNAYIGIEFQGADGVHYGWIRYTGFGVAEIPSYDGEGNLIEMVTGIDVAGGVIHSWAWETEPGKAIIAGAVPEPGSTILGGIATLGMLAKRRRG